MDRGVGDPRLGDNSAKHYAAEQDAGQRAG
jgi:hypothetical protein